VDRVVGVGPHAAVQVLGGVDDPVAGLGRPPFGSGHGVGGRAAGLEPPGGLQGGDPHGLGVDVGVGDAQHRPLEVGQRPSELLAGAQVVGGLADGLGAHARVQRAHERSGDGGEPVDGGGVADAHRRPVLEPQVAGQAPVGRDDLLDVDAQRRGVHQVERGGGERHRDQHPAGQRRRGHDHLGAGEAAVGVGPHRTLPRSRLPGLGQGHGDQVVARHDRVAGGGPGRVGDVPQRDERGERRPQRERREVAALGLAHERGVHHVGAAAGLADGREDAGGGQRGPQVPVDAVAAVGDGPLDALDPLDVGVVADDPVGQVAQGDLRFAEGEVH
jgi:hypothetical protein